MVNTYLLPDVLYSLPSRLGLDFDFSAITSGVFGAIIVLVMLLRPEGLVPARGVPTHGFRPLSGEGTRLRAPGRASRRAGREGPAG
jgi:hypothetical protein